MEVKWYLIISLVGPVPFISLDSHPEPTQEVQFALLKETTARPLPWDEVAGIIDKIDTGGACSSAVELERPPVACGAVCETTTYHCGSVHRARLPQTLL